MDSLTRALLVRESGLENKRRDFLPNDKQFLVTRNGLFSPLWHTQLCILTSILVPCYRRVKQMQQQASKDDQENELDGWVFPAQTTRVFLFWTEKERIAVNLAI